MIENPQPTWLPLLLFALPGIVFAAYAVNDAVFPRDDRPICTIPAIGIILAVLPTHILALALGSFSIGLAISWSVVGVAGYVWIVRHWRDFWSALEIEDTAWPRKLGIAALATMPIVLPTILLNFHDEVNYSSHQGIIAHLQNGTYPPRYLYEPTLPLRYHYAFDLAAAIVTGLFRVRIDHAIDLVTLALWLCTFGLLWRVGEHCGGRRAGLPVALTVSFAGGWPVLAGTQPACGLCSMNGLPINPPFISQFFQHPWSIGVPIFCLVVLQRAAVHRLRNQTLGLAALICSLTLLSLSEVVLFVLTVVALALAEAWNFARFRERDAAIVLLGLGAAVIGAKLIGGFFVSGIYPLAGGLFGSEFLVRPFSSPDDLIGQLQWNLASFGVLLILAPVGLLRVRHDRMLLMLLAMLSLVIVNLLRYRYPSDILKFSAVSSIVLAIAAGVVLSDFRAWAHLFVGKLLYLVVIVALVSQGVQFPFIVLFAYNPDGRSSFSNQMIRPYFSDAYPVDRDDAGAASFLRTHMRPSEIVFRAEEKAEPYAVWAGLPTQASWHINAAEPGDNDVYGLGEEKFAARRDLARISESWFDRLQAQHVAWIVTDPDDIGINTILQGPEGQVRALLVAQFGKIRIFCIR